MCVLSAMGTAAVINHHYTISDKTKSALNDQELEIVRELKGVSLNQKNVDYDQDAAANVENPRGCKMCHMSFGKLGIAVGGRMKRCAICK